MNESFWIVVILFGIFRFLLPRKQIRILRFRLANRPFRKRCKRNS